jgi:hypothetical protein
LTIRSGDPKVIDFMDRVFHLEILKGGMNRLLFRSNRSSSFPTRVEIIFMNVQYLSVGTSLDGLAVRDRGPAENWIDPNWRLRQRDEIRIYEVASASGIGQVIAGSVGFDESDAGPSDPSRFFMMD